MIRKSITKSAAITLTSLLVLCLLPAPVAAGGLGVTPPTLEIADALKGGEYQRTVRLFNTMEEVTNLSLSTSGDISQWVTFYDPGDLTTPIESIAVPSKENTSVLVKLSIPDDTANGTYSGSLHAETGALGEEGGQGIRLHTSVAVTISVTEPQGDGKLLSLDYEGQPATNAVTKIQATFQNTGTVETQAKFIAEVYRDGNLVDALQSEESIVAAGKQDTLTSYFKPDQPGNYSVKGHVIYGEKKTEEKEISFTVAGDGGTEAGQPFNLAVPAVIGVIGILIIVIIYILLRARQQV